MLRAGLEFFAFQPRQGETVAIIFLRFNQMLDTANREAQFGISHPLRTGIPFVRLPAKKWQDYPKELGDRFPQTDIEYTVCSQE